MLHYGDISASSTRAISDGMAGPPLRDIVQHSSMSGCLYSLILRAEDWQTVKAAESMHISVQDDQQHSS